LRERDRGAARRVLGYNNLLGFPYRFGYSRVTLERVLGNAGFTPVSFVDSGLLTPPYPDFSRRIRQEWKGVRECGAWIEVVCR
ncbi:MAG TPA: hypothetical protein VHA14_13385, partial [Bryobacteraceae bacterium]|nr:hypothetical protein [Bryobacteraceae bacterium]